MCVCEGGGVKTGELGEKLLGHEQQELRINSTHIIMMPVLGMTPGPHNGGRQALSL